MKTLLLFLWSALVVLVSVAPVHAQPPEAEWTFLVFLNGNNNLDDYGAMDINEMERVGSTPQLNVVVQWASLERGRVQRLRVEKDTDSGKVMSPIIEDIGDADMGDWRTLVEFVRWGVKNYPAKRYFIDVWNHGTGWHFRQHGLRPMDISWDDRSGHHIKTEELATALAESAAIMGHPVDLYGSDACLMGMSEVASQMAGSVNYFVGSEEVEPLEGWPYDALLAEWAKRPEQGADEVAKTLTRVFVKSYQGGSQGRSEVTLSAYDLGQLGELETAIAELGRKIQKTLPASREKIAAAGSRAQSFTESDYRDLLDFLDELEKAKVEGLDSHALAPVRAASKRFIIANEGTRQYARAKGLAIWLPSSKWDVESYLKRYQGLRFHGQTAWGDVIEALQPK